VPLDATFAQPHEEALAFLQGKPAVSRAVFDRLLPEIKARAFTVSGIESASTIQRIRDQIAGLAIGGDGNTWDDVKARVVDDLAGAGFDDESAQRRAETLLRTHGNQAFESANLQAALDDEDTTHLQYLSMEDENVRDSHAALNGLILPKNDPFWETHTPPWEWGCRCSVRPVNPDLVDMERAFDQERAPENRNVIEGAVADQLRTGTLIRDGRRYNVSPGEGPNAFRSSPGSLRLSLDDLQARYDPDVFADFARFARKQEIQPGKTIWDWLIGN
jgi:SPP1 gp7 family putative phage head morphogenesis protein